MNLISYLALVIKRARGARLRADQLSSHLRRDIGLDNVSSARRVAQPEPRSGTLLIIGGLSRAP